jgi:hypothetical protein
MHLQEGVRLVFQFREVESGDSFQVIDGITLRQLLASFGCDYVAR